MRPYFVFGHLPICENAHKNIERIVSEGSAVIGKGRRARRVVRHNIWEQCPCDPLRLSRRIYTRMLQSVRAHRRSSVAPKAELGTSRAMLQTSLSPKKSSPVNCRLFFAPSTSQKKGSLRQPAKKR